MPRKWSPQLGHFPPNTFIHDYMEYMNHVETSTIYDTWSALWLLSIACGRLVFVDRPRTPVYLNNYVILCADSGITRKSTAVRMAHSICKEFNATLPETERYGFIENKSSPEAIALLMRERSAKYDAANIAVCIEEMVVFFGREKYTMTMPGFMTDMYDAPTERSGGGMIRDVKEGTSPIRNVYMNLLTASTSTWLMRAINPDVVEGGFTSRTIFVVSEERKHAIPWPDTNDTVGVTRETLVSRLTDIRDRARAYGTISLQPSALKTFADWYKSRYTYRDPYRASFDSREDGHVLRCAALLAANDGQWRITSEHIRYAIRMVSLAKSHGAGLFEGTTQKTGLMIGLDRIRDILIASGKEPVKRSFLLFKVQRYMNANELTSALDVLHELDMVQKFEVESTTPGRPATLYRATRNILSRGAIQSVVERLSEQ